jgi:hypothetical protein
MELAVGLFQIGDGEAQITLGRVERAMPQDVLHMAQVGLVLDQVRGARGSGVSPHYLHF